LKRFAVALSKSDYQAKALLPNLKEEDRLPADKCAAFHAALIRSRQRRWKDRFMEAVPAAQRAVQVPTPRPGCIVGTWWHHVPLGALEKYNYVSLALHRSSRPPPRLRLLRRIGRPEAGSDRTFWITDASGSDADDTRDRLGLCFILRGQHLYRIEVGLAAPHRALFIPTAIDAAFYPAWRRPGAEHTEECGMTRHLGTDVAAERELLALPDDADALQAEYVGPIKTDPPREYLRARGILRRPEAPSLA